MKLITLEEDYPIFNPEARMIKEFNALITRDRGTKGDHDGRKKKLATKELAFVHFISHHNSEFVQNYPEKERIEKIKKSIDLPVDWFPDSTVDAACKKYKEITGHSPTIDSLQEVRDTLHSGARVIRLLRIKMEEALDKLDDLKQDEEAEKETNKIVVEVLSNYDRINSIASKIPIQIESITQLEKKVLQENQDKVIGRKGEEVSEFEL